jgi:hypothetical protein
VEPCNCDSTVVAMRVAMRIVIAIAISVIDPL